MDVSARTFLPQSLCGKYSTSSGPDARRPTRGLMNTRDISMSDPEPERITERKALVIGINAYTRKPLSNCLNDASAVHEALKRMGFASTLLREPAAPQARCSARKLLRCSAN